MPLVRAMCHNQVPDRYHNLNSKSDTKSSHDMMRKKAGNLWIFLIGNSCLKKENNPEADQKMGLIIYEN